MIRHNPNAPLDPALDAALLLRRIGFATLTLALPLVSLVSRRAAVVLVPIGVALIALAAMIEESGQFGRNLRDTLLTRPSLFLIGFIAWAVLSRVWSPFAASAAEKATNLILAVALGLCAAAALPERMRTANLNLIPLGTGMGAMFAVALIALAAMRMGTVPAGLERGVSIILIMSWPGFAWLLSRERGLTTLCLALVVGVLALTRIDTGEAAAMACGAVAFGAISANRRTAATGLAVVVAGLLLLAPLLPLLFQGFAGLMPADMARTVAVWAELVRSEPLRLITGHGLDTVLRGRLAGVLPPETPASLLFETWYEFGLVGAAAGAACLFFAIRATGQMSGPLAAGVAAAYVTAFALAAFGFATYQAWWLMTLASVALIFTAIARGQHRMARPVAPLSAGQATPSQTRPKAGPPVG